MEELTDKKRSSMVWSMDKDLALLKDIAAEGVFRHKSRSKERGAQWQKVAANITTITQQVTARGARDRYNVMSKKYRVKMGQEHRATGGGGKEVTELERLLEELIEIEDEAEKQITEESEAKKRRVERERQEALEMRERAMERYGETRKRVAGNEESGETSRGPKRRRSSDMMDWLKERVELEKEKKEEKRKDEQGFRDMMGQQQLQILEAMQQTQQQIGLQMQHQQQQQQDQLSFMQQQMMLFMQQQQQQTQLLVNLLDKKLG